MRRDSSFSAPSVDLLVARTWLGSLPQLVLRRRAGEVGCDVAGTGTEPSALCPTHRRRAADEANRLGVVEGMRVALALPLPGAEPLDGLVVRREPPFAWVELASLGPAAPASRAG